MRDIIFSPRHSNATEAEIKEVKNVMKSCIMTRKGGMPTSELRDEYKNMTDEDIPIFKLGYNSLFHLLRDIPEIKSQKNEQGVPVLVVKENERNKHLIDLVRRQKDPKTYRPRRPLRRLERKSTRHNAFDENRFIPKRVIEPSEDENFGTPIIYTEYSFEEKMSECTEPVVGSSQLIGDDYFLQLCFKYLKYDLLRKERTAPISCGTVQSGLTIRKAIKRLDNIKIMSNKLCINLGTVDIYNRHTDEEMIEDYLYLLDKLTKKYGYSSSQITLCTLPPIGNISMFAEPKKYYACCIFNNWLRNHAEKFNYNLLDLHKEFTDENNVIDYHLFQKYPRMVSGTSHAHFLWSYFGRQKAMKLLLNLNYSSFLIKN